MASSPVRDRPLRADARRNHDRILEAAATIFAADGPDLQMADVAKRAGVGLGTVYRHFPTKAALAAQLIAEGLDRFAQHGRDSLAAGGTGWDALVNTIERTLESAEKDAGTRHAVAHLDAETWPAIEPARRRLHDVYDELIAGAQAEGTLRSDFEAGDLETIMRSVCSIIGHPRYESDWHRHLGYILCGLRTSQALPGEPSP